MNFPKNENVPTYITKSKHYNIFNLHTVRFYDQISAKIQIIFYNFHLRYNKT